MGRWKKVWISSEMGVSQKVSWDEFTQLYVWHNTTFIANTSGSIVAIGPSLSFTAVGEATIIDSEPHIEKLPFHPKQVIGCMGLIGLAIRSYLAHDNEFCLLTFKQKIVLMRFSQKKLIDMSSFNPPQNIQENEALSIIIPQLLQFGIRFGDSHCQLFQIENQHTWTTSLIDALSIPKSKHHTIKNLGPWLINTWWEHKDVITPSKKNLPLPVISNRLMMGLAVLWLTLWAAQTTTPQITVTKIPAANPQILGTLTSLGLQSKSGPQALLQKIQNIPETSRIELLVWENDKIYLSGYSHQSADPHIIQKTLHEGLNIPFSELSLTYSDMRNKKTISKWAIGEAP